MTADDDELGSLGKFDEVTRGPIPDDPRLDPHVEITFVPARQLRRQHGVLGRPYRGTVRIRKVRIAARVQDDEVYVSP